MIGQIPSHTSQQQGGIFWFTGLSGAGKTSLAIEAQRVLQAKGVACIVLDGDRLRHGLNADLGFSEGDRIENMRRTAEVAALLSEQGFAVIVALISPLQQARARIRQRFVDKNYAEIYVSCSLEVCEQRDVKGLYARARAGEIKQFTGIDSVFEPPTSADLVLDTEVQSLGESVVQLIQFIEHRQELSR